MDVMRQVLVAATAERHMVIVNLANPGTIFKQVESPLKWQTRTVACFPDGTGYAIGSIEGRVGIQYVDDARKADNFTFKCHRSDPNVYAVNCITFHQQYGTFATTGSDSSFYIWDKDSKQRVRTCINAGNGVPIPAAAFSRTGQIFAYAVSYDWSKVCAVLLPCAWRG